MSKRQKDRSLPPTFPISEHYNIAKRGIVACLRYLGEDPNRAGLKETPDRILKSWGELFKGYALDPQQILSKNFYEKDYDEIISFRDIEFTSFCEHHWLPFIGKAHIGYIPNNHVVGASKLGRLVDVYACRLQIQERLTVQIATSLNDAISPKGVAVVLEAKHSCMMCRGVKKQQSIMTTSKLIGVFKDDPAARSEFLRLIGK
jgi:GTP cyclohydrolase I